MIPVFQAFKSVNDWCIALTPEAATIIGVNWLHADLDQYGKISSVQMSKELAAQITPPDAMGMVSRFVREAAAYTRQRIHLPRRPARRSPAKMVMCRTMARIANERLMATGPFWPGVDTHGLAVVFASLIDGERAP